MQPTLIAAAMRRHGFSSSDVRLRLRALNVRVTLQTVRNWRDGRTPPREKHRATVAAVLKIDLPALLMECMEQRTEASS